MSALGVPQTKIFLGVYFAMALFRVEKVVRVGALSLLVAILANTSVLKWYHVAIYAIALEILGRLIKEKKDGDLGSRIDIIRGFTSGWPLVALIVYLRRSQSF